MLLIGYEIIVIGVAYALLAVFVQRKLSNMDKMYEMQDNIKKKSDELMELTKAGNTSKEVLDAKQKEVMGIVSQSMKNQLKPMFVVFPLFIIVYYYALPFAFAAAAASATFPFNLHYQTLFIVVTFIIGFLTSMTLMSMDKKRLKKLKETAPQQ